MLHLRTAFRIHLTSARQQPDHIGHSKTLKTLDEDGIARVLALVVIDHPKVARAFEGSVTESDRHYFVRELVRRLIPDGFEVRRGRDGKLSRST
jgi:hypothetical protein